MQTPRFARAGVPLVQAQRLLGHSDPRLTSEIYVHLEADDMRAAVESLPACEPDTDAEISAKEA